MGLAIVGAGTIVGALLLWGWEQVRPDFERWVREDPVPRGRTVLAGLALFMLGPLFAMSAYLWRVGGSASRHRRLMRSLAGLLAVTAALMGALLLRLGATL